MRHFEPQILVLFSPRGFSASNLKACLWCMFILWWCPWRLAKLLLVYTLVPFGMFSIDTSYEDRTSSRILVVGFFLNKFRKKKLIVVLWNHNIVKPKHMWYMETASNMLQWALSLNFAMKSTLGLHTSLRLWSRLKRPSFKPTLQLALSLYFGTFVHKNKFVLVFRSYDQHTMLYYNSNIFAKVIWN